MFKGVRFFPPDSKIDFVGIRHIGFVVTAVMIIGTIYLCATRGLNFGIDFTGGTLIEIQVPQTPDLSELREKLNALEIGDVSIQEFGGAQDLLLRLPQQDGGPEAQKAAIEKVKTLLSEKFSGAKVDYRRVEYVGPQVGEELKKAGMWAILWSIIGIVVYVWFRFEWQYGAASVISLIHDTTAVIGLFALTQIPFDLSTVAAVLLVAGYSINDTVVVFDRIRENLRKFKKTATRDILNMAINETLSRTTITSGTTLLALVALWIFGGEVIRGFVVALIFGIFVGTYSSIFVAAPILLYLNVRRAVLPAVGQGTDADEDAQVAKA